MAEDGFMERKKRRSFAVEYKAEVVGAGADERQEHRTNRQELGRTETAVRSWVKRAGVDEKCDPNDPLTSQECAELTRLRRELKTVTMVPPKSVSLLRRERKMSFELIEAQKARYPKALMCRALGLSRSGHHAFGRRGLSRRALERQQLDVLVAAIFLEFKRRYGAPRIEQEMRRRGHRASKKRVAAAMARQGLVDRPRRRW
jgi:hypothetical protein